MYGQRCRNSRRGLYWLIGVALIAAVTPKTVADEVRIWSNGSSPWVTTFPDGDPIDTGTANDAEKPQLVVDSASRVYTTFRQSDGSKYHIYLVRYDGTDMKIWDNGASTWTVTLADGDPIDTGTANDCDTPQLAMDSADRVYVTFRQYDGSTYHIYLSRYDGTDVKIWDNGASTWTDTFANGDPIDLGTANGAFDPHLAVDSADRVYVTFKQYDGSKYHIHLSRYDGTDAKIWDNDLSAWTNTFANGDPINTGTANDAGLPKLAVDSADRCDAIAVGTTLQRMFTPGR